MTAQRLLFAIAGCLLLAACSSAPETVPVRPARLTDFAGHWEKDYQLSDDFSSKFNLYLHDVRRALTPSTNGVPAYGPVFSGSNEALLGLARLTEEITRMPVVEISQDEDGILVDREDSFALRCDWFADQYARSGNAFGSELCGWSGEQLLFFIDLDGLSIRHQLTLGPDGQQLNITTTVTSGAVSFPMTISNYYRRFERAQQGFDCTLTLSRNKVCSRTAE